MSSNKQIYNNADINGNTLKTKIGHYYHISIRINYQGTTKSDWREPTNGPVKKADKCPRMEKWNTK